MAMLHRTTTHLRGVFSHGFVRKSLGTGGLATRYGCIVGEGGLPRRLFSEKHSGWDFYSALPPEQTATVSMFL